MPDAVGLLLIVFIALVLFLLLWVAVWTLVTVVVGIRLSRLCRRAGIANPGLSYLPILADTRVARLAGANPWWNVLALIPIANVAWLALTLVWTRRIARAGGTMVWWLVSLAAIVIASAILFFDATGGAVAYLVAAVIIGLCRWFIFDPDRAESLDSRMDHPSVGTAAVPMHSQEV